MDSDVQFVIEGIEVAFEVKFDASEIGDEPTFESVYAALRSHVEKTDSHRCFSSVVFWRLRRTMTELLGLRKDSFRLDTPVEPLLGNSRNRRDAWLAIGEKSGLRLPGLELPKWIALMLMALTLGPCFTVIHWIGNAGVQLWWKAVAILVTVIATPFVGNIWFRLARPFAGKLPVHSLTMRDLTRTVVGLNYGMLAKELGPSRDNELRKALEYVIRDITVLGDAPLDGEDFPLLALAMDGLRGHSNLV